MGKILLAFFLALSLTPLELFAMQQAPKMCDAACQTDDYECDDENPSKKARVEECKTEEDTGLDFSNLCVPRELDIPGFHVKITDVEHISNHEALIISGQLDNHSFFSMTLLKEANHVRCIFCSPYWNHLFIIYIYDPDKKTLIYDCLNYSSNYHFEQPTKNS